MKMYRYWIGIIALAAALVLVHNLGSTSSAQPVVAAGSQDAVGAVAQSITTQMATISVTNQKGEPRISTAKVTFDRQVLACWVSTAGADIAFERTNEKQIHRVLFNVDPFAKVINGKDVEVSGKLGMCDGSGRWDDAYEGTINVAVTAILGSR